MSRQLSLIISSKKVSLYLTHNILKSNSINRVVDPGLFKYRQHEPHKAEREVENIFKNNNILETRPKISETIRSKITTMSTEFSSPSKR